MKEKYTELIRVLEAWIYSTQLDFAKKFREQIIEVLIEQFKLLASRNKYNSDKAGIDIITYAELLMPDKISFEPMIILKALRAIAEYKEEGRIGEDTIKDLISYCLFELAKEKYLTKRRKK